MFPPEPMEAYPVGKAVDYVKNEGLELVARLAGPTSDVDHSRRLSVCCSALTIKWQLHQRLLEPAVHWAPAGSRRRTTMTKIETLCCLGLMGILVAFGPQATAKMRRSRPASGLTSC